MKLAKPLTVIATSLVALTVSSGCANSGNPDASKSADSAENVESEGDRPDLSTALLTVDDLAGLKDEYGTFEETELAQSSSDLMMDGPEQCADYLDRSYSSESVADERTAFHSEYEADAGDDPAHLYVLSEIKEFASTEEAAEALDALRDIFSVCDAYTLDGDSTEVTIDVLNFGEASGDLDVGDAGLTLAMSETAGEANLLGEYAYVFTQVDEFIVTSGAYKAGLVMPIDADLMSLLTSEGVDRVREYVDAG